MGAGAIDHEVVGVELGNVVEPLGSVKVIVPTPPMRGVAVVKLTV